MNTYRQEQTGTRILELSDFFNRVPFIGHWLRNRLLRKTIPYSRLAAISVEYLIPGHCITSIKEVTQLQNEHYSIHESALSTLAEHASRLALLTGLPPNATANLVTFSIQHHKVAHGEIKAECRCALPDSGRVREYSLIVAVTDSSGTTVATAAANWLVNGNSEQGALLG